MNSPDFFFLNRGGVVAVIPSPNPAGCLARAEVLQQLLLDQTDPATASPEEEAPFP
jgi:hypothetical protein